MIKVALVHNEYRHKGGEETVVANELELVKQKGHDSELYQVSSQAIKTGLDKMRTAMRLSYSKESKRSLKRFLQDFKPDVVHVHNWFPLLTPSIFDACLEFQIPVVQTLHNFRITCASGLLLRHGRVCEDCIGGSPYRGAIHGCYQGSRLASLAVAKMISAHRNQDTWNRKISKFITPSVFAKTKFAEAGVREELIAVKPHFTFDPFLDNKVTQESRATHALYIGRLSPEKGINTLLSAFQELGHPLTIIGDGPLRTHVEAASGSSITYLGAMTQKQISQQLLKAGFLVAPSECHETFGLAILEAFAHELPVVAANNSSFTELVVHHHNGIVFNAGNKEALKSAVTELVSSAPLRAQLSMNARKTYLAKYTPEKNYSALMSIYEEVLGQNRTHQQSHQRPQDN